ncbi:MULTISPECIES: hypothetical protein [Thermococcus]|uniref:hypothetical protein n=1 Tax=Thermococcus TaxID=2263 RepID=UPI00073A8736|nr:MULTISPECIES: hypothetical protein [Thermococcus]ALV63634.1 hypothetical protein ADU37_CDS19350 [Thermococcus sp. 2319x1]
MKKTGVEERGLAFIPLFLYVTLTLIFLRNEPFSEIFLFIVVGVISYAFAVKFKSLAPFAIVIWYLLMAMIKYLAGTLTDKDLLVFAMSIAFWIPISLIIYFVFVNRPSKTNG